MRSTIAIDVAAPAELVFRLARDVEHWPDLLPHYLSARRLAAPDERGRLLVRFVASRALPGALAPGLPVAWQSLTWSEEGPPHRLRFVHRGGATNGMDVTWRIEDLAAGSCHVEIAHDFRPRIRAWARLVDQLFTRPIAGRTLATFRAIAEASAGAASESSPTTNPRT